MARQPARRRPGRPARPRGRCRARPRRLRRGRGARRAALRRHRAGAPRGALPPARLGATRASRPARNAARPRGLAGRPLPAARRGHQGSPRPAGRRPSRPRTPGVGDDGAPVPGTDVIAACDAILPSMVERDPEWAGWCAVLVNVNDLSAMGATPVGLLDALGARDASFARRVLRGLSDAARAWGVPVLGGHTQLGVPAALSVTALGRTDRPVPGGGAGPGQRLRVTADLGGGWRPGYTGSQWDSTRRTPAELRALAGVVPALAPAAAKDVSMAGLVGTVGMLAEASGCGAVLDVADIPAPAGATRGDWLTCFPGFAIVTAEEATRQAAPGPAGPGRQPCPVFSPVRSAASSSPARASLCAGPTGSSPRLSPPSPAWAAPDMRTARTSDDRRDRRRSRRRQLRPGRRGQPGGDRRPHRCRARAWRLSPGPARGLPGRLPLRPRPRP